MGCIIVWWFVDIGYVIFDFESGDSGIDCDDFVYFFYI